MAKSPQLCSEGVSLSRAMARQRGRLHYGSVCRRNLYATEAHGSQRDIVRAYFDERWLALSQQIMHGGNV